MRCVSAPRSVLGLILSVDRMCCWCRPKVVTWHTSSPLRARRCCKARARKKFLLQPRPRQKRRRVRHAKKWKPIWPRFRPSSPAGWRRISIIRCGRPYRCAVTAAALAPVFVRPAIASTLSTSTTARTKGCGGAIGIPARPRNLLSMPPDTIRGGARTNASVSVSSTSFRFIPQSLATFSVPAAAVAPGHVQAAWIFRPLLAS